MLDLKVIVIVFVTMHINVCSNVNTLIKLDTHKNFIKQYNFSCHTPQPRALQIKDLIPDYWNETFQEAYTSGAIDPPVTILHRCQGSGCCDTYTTICEAKREDPIDLQFKVFEKIISITVTNHTECGCGQINTEENNIK